MAAEGSDPALRPLVLVCPSCQARCRVRQRSARKPLACPRCKGTLPAVAVPGPPAEEGLVPLPAAPRRADPDDEEPGDPTYGAHEPQAKQPVEVPQPDRFEVVALRRKRPPAPVAPLWWGVYGFPWHAGALRPWFLCGLGLGLVTLMAAGLHFAIDLYEDTELGRGGIYFRVIILYIKACVAFLVWSGAYAATFFLTTVEDTAAGVQKVVWPDQSIWEAFLAFFYLAWLFLCAAVPLALVAASLRGLLGPGVVGWSLLPSLVLVFPFVLLSAVANSSWFGFNADVCVGLLVRPLVLLILWAMSAVLLCPCVALGYLAIGDYREFLFLAPLTGFVWSACLFIYARLLGRVGWIITGAHEQARRVPRKRRRRPAVAGDGQRTPSC
jgi:hypothetical protein